VPPRLQVWRVALLLAGPAMVVTVALATLAGVGLLQLPWPAALVLAAALAPTDPVLASEVQIGSAEDRDAVRLSLTAEGGLNDGSALPAVMLGLGLMGLHPLGDNGQDWLLHDVAWSIGGAAALGIALGRGLGRLLKARIMRGDPVARDELLYVAAVTLAYGLARVTGTSTFVVMFAVGATLLWPFHGEALQHGGHVLSQRLCGFGASLERLVEAATVLVVGLALHSAPPTWSALAYGLVLVLVVRPVSVLAVVWPGVMTRHQRRLTAWFGIRGTGTLFYLAFVIEHGVAGTLADEMLSAGLTAIALSIVLHGISATPLMAGYKSRRTGVPKAP
jgi:NhaP-type Na+/H+ or K+/H+ antiporter